MCADIHAHVDDCVIRYPAELLLPRKKKKKKRRDAKKVVAVAATTLVFSLFWVVFGWTCSFDFPIRYPDGSAASVHIFFFYFCASQKRNYVAAVRSLKLRELCGISTNDTASSATLHQLK
jgi:hypothetical protein